MGDMEHDKHDLGWVQPCHECRGLGYIPITGFTGTGYATLDDTCLECDGEGWVPVDDV